MRGFAVGGIGPRDSITTDALGGTYFYTGTAELSFPLGLPKEIGLLGKAFVDVGSLWGTEGAGTSNRATVLTARRCACRPASAFNGYRHSARSV